MYFWPSASHMYAPWARAMKRGVPPTARKARTGELTPPGIEAWARSKSWALVDTARASGGNGLIGSVEIVGGGAAGIRAGFGAFLVLGRQGPEEAVGHDMAHAGAEAGVQALVQELQGLAHGGRDVRAH